MEKKMETTIVYWGYIRILEKKMETKGLAFSKKMGLGFRLGFRL